MKKKIAISSDHAGFTYKEKLIQYIKKNNFEVVNFGCFTIESVNYPDYVHPVSRAVKNGEIEKAIILCGSGNGAIMVANKYPKVRAALCWTKEITTLARTHNDANICCLPARFISYKEAEEFVEIFLRTEFVGGKHTVRVKKIDIDRKSVV